MRKKIRELIKEQILKESSLNKGLTNIDHAINLLTSLKISNIDDAIRYLGSIPEFGLDSEETKIKLMWRLNNTYEVMLCFKDLDYAEYVHNELEQKINLQKQNRNQSKYGAFATMKNRKLSDADSIYYSVPGIYYLRIINDWKRKGSQMIVFKIVVED